MITSMQTDEAHHFSYPKSKLKTLLLENIHPSAQAVFDAEGYPVESVAKALSVEELKEQIADVSILGIRSNTHITAEVLDSAKRLFAIGAFCIGTNQIDLKACAERGITVFNAPYSNTRSVVELTVGLMIMLHRKIFDKSIALHAGKWEKSGSWFSRNTSQENRYCRIREHWLTTFSAGGKSRHGSVFL